MVESMPIGQPGGPTPPEKIQTGPSGPTSDASVSGLRSLEDLKQVLIAQYGEEEGKKMYNKFMVSLAMSILAQVKEAQDRATEASKEAREQPS